MNRLTRAPIALSSRISDAASRPARLEVPAVIRGALVRRIGHERHLVGTHLADQREELRGGVAFDVVFDRRRELVPDQRRELGHVGAPDMALVGARMHRDAVRPGARPPDAPPPARSDSRRRADCAAAPPC